MASEQGYSEEDQTQFLVRLERACIDNPDLPPTFVANCLMSLSETRLDETPPFAPRNSGIQA
ncbi:hypothetical protein [Polynucleobacter sp. MWH-Aus1W21]|uniref:hypothetical protein n=1 Tax=Polynucleobacter sp. MWH-Aus1W21 TaxID=1855880 RepID=UPI001BFE84AA|nr:hypothetical protein [Polynucleobacter sp. MWH-Aus1W21]QWD65214.1 hypothetical protein ICW03_05920 [Polynucleobacter sp. MWH-Aus1W21]